jgi:polyphosphate kinase
MKGLKNRDVNWLYFNERVLQEAEDPRVPLLERLKFLAIFSSNLDEFFKVRISQMRQLKSVDKELRKKLSLKVNKQLLRVLGQIGRQQERFGQAIESTLSALREKGIFLRSLEELDLIQEEFLRDHFTQYLQKELEVLDLRPSSMKDGGLYLVVDLEASAVLIPIPAKRLGRFISLPGKEHNVIYLDDTIRLCMEALIPGIETSKAYSIKLSRDAELYLDDDYTDTALVEKIYKSLNKRASGQPTRLLFDKNMPDHLLNTVKERLELGEADLVAGGRYHSISDFFTFPNPERTEGLLYEELPPLPHPILPLDKTIFECIQQQDQLIHFPYQRFDHLEAFIQQAAEDPAVRSIKMTLYRIAKQSALTDALLKATKNGKEVVVFVEAQARFDEENNIHWGRLFEEAGAEVIFSVPQIKVHSKIALVTREYNGIEERFGYIGTGNFNAKTARLYCDHGLFTAHNGITKDLEQVFLLLQKKLLYPKLKHLVVSPFTTRNRFLELVRYEAEQAQKGEPSGITLKMNSLEDSTMIQALQQAAEQGVPIRLLIRGFCCLKQKRTEDLLPGEHPIHITSIVDRFLEHGRIYHFEHGGDPQLFMGSADWMTRNLDRRIEVLAPIYHGYVAQELRDILQLQLADNVKARILDRDDQNSYVTTKSQDLLRSQYAIYDYLRLKSAELQ